MDGEIACRITENRMDLILPEPHVTVAIQPG